MSKDSIENRKNIRIYFSEEDHIRANFIYKKIKPIEVTATVLNISAGGIGLLIKREGEQDLKPQDHLIIKSLSGPNPINKITGIEIEIRYILDYPQGNGIYLGCRFIKVPKDLVKSIDQFVHSKLKEFGRDSYRYY